MNTLWVRRGCFDCYKAGGAHSYNWTSKKVEEIPCRVKSQRNVTIFVLITLNFMYNMQNILGIYFILFTIYLMTQSIVRIIQCYMTGSSVNTIWNLHIILLCEKITGRRDKEKMCLQKVEQTRIPLQSCEYYDLTPGSCNSSLLGNCSANRIPRKWTLVQQTKNPFLSNEFVNTQQ
jgi:hypothetical protein